MREIKFRGIYPHSGQFFYGYFVNAFPDTPRIVGDGFSTPINVETLGQYTGLKDKNGVEIYEWDIVKLYHDEAYSPIPVDFKGTVKLMGGAWYIDTNNMAFLVWQEIAQWEVIGNIHQNKNLLK